VFDCKACAPKDEEIKFLREQVKDLQNKLTCIADARAYQTLNSGPIENPELYYGTGHDDYVEYDQFGQKVITSRIDK
jgi:hypothetical protein